jgi:hypothetical protein
MPSKNTKASRHPATAKLSLAKLIQARFRSNALWFACHDSLCQHLTYEDIRPTVAYSSTFAAYTLNHCLRSKQFGEDETNGMVARQLAGRGERSAVL